MSILNGTDRHTRRQVLQYTGALTLSGWLAACGGSSSSGGSATQAAGGAISKRSIDSLTVALPSIPDALDTVRASAQLNATVLLGLEPLLRLSPANGKITPNLALSFEQPSATRYVLKLRDGVTFWDGSPLTLDDVLASFKVHYEKGTESLLAKHWQYVSNVSKQGDDTVVIDLASPYSRFEYVLAFTGIFSAAYAAKHKGKLGSPGVLNMGTGPYKFTAFQSGSRVQLERNESYWGGRPRVGKLDARLPAPDALVLGAQSGELDAVFGVPLAQLKSFQGLGSFALQDTADFSVYKLNFEQSRGPWTDPHLRRALAHTIDRNAIATGVLNNSATPAFTLIPPSVLETVLPQSEVTSSIRDIAALVPAFDLDKARAELAQSRYPNGIETTVIVQTSDPNTSSIVQTIAASAKQVGIKLNVREADDQTYYNAVYFRHTTDGVGIDNSGVSTPDPLNMLDTVVNSSEALPQGSGFNAADYRNASADKALTQANALRVDDPKRGRLALQVERQVATDTPYAPIVFPNVYLGLKDTYAYSDFNFSWWSAVWPDQIGEKA